MKLTPVSRSSLADEVHAQLEAEILQGRLSPGDALPPERALCEVLGVNRGAVREAIQRLVAQGLVRTRQGDGTRVLDFRHSAGLDLLPRLLVRGEDQVDPMAVRAVAELRATIGADAAARAAERADAVAIRRLETRLGVLEDAATRAARQDAALALWEAVVDAADNVAYRLAFNSLVAAYRPVQSLLSGVLAEEVDDLPGHAAVVDAIARAEPVEARRAASELLARGSRALGRVAEALPALDGPSLDGPALEGPSLDDPALGPEAP